MGGDVSAGIFWDFVADFELFHELKHFMVEVSVLGVSPDIGEIIISEVSEIGYDMTCIKYSTDSGGTPVWFKNKNVTQYGI